MGEEKAEDSLTEMLIRDNRRYREAGDALAAAAMRVTHEYDGIHRLNLAVSGWAQAVANESGRSQNTQLAGELVERLRHAKSIMGDDLHCVRRGIITGFLNSAPGYMRLIDDAIAALSSRPDGVWVSIEELAELSGWYDIAKDSWGEFDKDFPALAKALEKEKDNE